jgi:hypothetical protein
MTLASMTTELVARRACRCKCREQAESEANFKTAIWTAAKLVSEGAPQAESLASVALAAMHGIAELVRDIALDSAAFLGLTVGRC